MKELDKTVVKITEIVEQTLEEKDSQGILDRYLKTHRSRQDAELADKVASVVRATVYRILSVKRVQPTLDKVIRDLGLD